MRDANLTRERIVECAGPLFAKNGFDGATVREICEAARVNLASVNYYFGDKSGLYAEVLKLARESQKGRFPYTGFVVTGNAVDGLRDFITVLLNRLGVGGKDDDWQVQVLVRELLRPAEVGRDIVQSFFKPYFSRLLELIGHISERQLTREQQLRIGFSVIGQCLHYRIAGPIIEQLSEGESFAGVWDTVQIADHITRFTLGGIASICKTRPRIDGASEWSTPRVSSQES